MDHSTEGREWTLLRNARDLLTHLAPSAVREEMNAYDNNTATERAWFSIARGAMAQTDALLQFEALYDAHPSPEEKKMSVVSNERAVENERLVSKLGCLEKEKTDSIGKLLPTVVRRLLNSHEYKESLSIPFNLAIQAGWAKGLAVKRSEEDLMDVLREVQGFDPHSDTRMAVEYDKLFTKTYPFVEKISGLPRRTVQELLKMYPAPPPQDAPTKVNPSSQAPDSSKSVPPRG
ncbi:hypothetical protein Tco_0789966 [Tanacetum coccineum]